MTPEMNNDTFDVELANHIWNEIKGMKNSTYIPTTKAELIAMDNIDLKNHMMLNEAFYNAAIMLLDNEVNMYIAFLKEMDDELADIAKGVLPEGYTWHHNEKEGLMQLVDTVTHDATGHTGGMSLWGIGYN